MPKKGLAPDSPLLGPPALICRSSCPGNGKSLHVDGGGQVGHRPARFDVPVCAFSGQEDLQFETGGSKGVPGHLSPGQIPKEGREFLTSIGSNPGKACNPNIGPPQEP